VGALAHQRGLANCRTIILRPLTCQDQGLPLRNFAANVVMPATLCPPACPAPCCHPSLP
jgi:hypothetical protein